jgi:hypothetical protein
MGLKPLICLSSGIEPRYRLDILRLLALPIGTHIQFRYAEDLIPGHLLDPLAKNQLASTPALLAHVDCTPEAPRSDQKCPITPCRYAHLIRSTRIGHYFILRFCLTEFAPCSDLHKFDTQISSQRPTWTKTNDKIEGYWCFEGPVDHHTCPHVNTTEAWQNIIKELAQRKDFSTESFFFTVTGIYPRESEELLSPESGEFNFHANRNYEARIFHFHPPGDMRTMPTNSALIKVEVSSPQLESITAPTLPIDSPYDLKSFHFQASDSARLQFAALVIRIDNRADGKPVETQPELYLPAKVKPATFRLLASALAIGVLLWLQQWMAAAEKGPISVKDIVILLILALATAFIVVFGLKKPL